MSRAVFDVLQEKSTSAAASGADLNSGLRDLPLDSIQPDPKQPRKTFTKEAIDELAATIREQGVIEPIVVEPDPSDSSRFLIVVGERRWRASKRAGKTTIPSVIRPSLTEADRLILQVMENDQRENLTLAELAESYQRLLDLTGKDAKDLATLVGKKPSTFTNILRARKAVGTAKEALDKGAITNAETLRLFSQLDDKDQARLLKSALDGGISITRPMVEKRLGQLAERKGAAPSPHTEPQLPPATSPPNRERRSSNDWPELTFRQWLTLLNLLNLPTSDDVDDMAQTFFEFLEARASADVTRE